MECSDKEPGSSCNVNQGDSQLFIQSLDLPGDGGWLETQVIGCGPDGPFGADGHEGECLLVIYVRHVIICIGSRSTIEWMVKYEDNAIDAGGPEA